MQTVASFFGTLVSLKVHFIVNVNKCIFSTIADTAANWNNQYLEM